MTITIDMSRFERFLEQINEVFGLDGPVPLTFVDFDDVDTFVQELLGASVPTPLNLPQGAEAVAYTFHDDPGWVFCLRQRDSDPHDPFRYIGVSNLFVESKDLEPRDRQERLPVDGAEWTANLEKYEACLAFSLNVADELTPLVAAYEKLHA